VTQRRQSSSQLTLDFLLRRDRTWNYRQQGGCREFSSARAATVTASEPGAQESLLKRKRTPNCFDRDCRRHPPPESPCRAERRNDRRLRWQGRFQARGSTLVNCSRRGHATSAREAPRAHFGVEGTGSRNSRKMLRSNVSSGNGTRNCVAISEARAAAPSSPRRLSSSPPLLHEANC
jgi:hypothetical protein